MPFDDADLLTEATARDPYAVFAALRAHDPVHWHAATSTWYVTSYPLVRRLLLEPTMSARPGDYLGEQDPADLPVVKRMEAFFNSWMLFSDPPRQTALRKAVSAGFTKSTSESWRGYARQVAGGRLAGLSGEVDLMADYAKPLAARLTCALLGVPEGDDEQLRKWSVDLLGYLFTPTADADRARTAAGAVDELDGYLREVVAPRLRSGADARLEPMRGLADLPPDAALALFTQLLTGGVDPVASCLTTTLGVLLDPGAERLRADAGGSIAAVVEEALRYDAPFHFVPRSTTAELTVGEHTIAAGRRVVLVIAAANRDPGVFPDPDGFRPHRDGPPHLSFGLGGHYCLGAILARVVVEEGVRAALPALGGATGPTARRGASFGATTWERMTVGL